MSNLTTIRALAAAAAVAVVAGLAFSANANASTASQLNKCNASSRDKAKECCEQVVRRYGPPIQFSRNNMNCSTAVRCFGKVSTEITFVAQKRCRVYFPPIHENNDKPQEKQRSQQ